jgi:TonB-linked SusC/RagA family outer membrane protein
MAMLCPFLAITQSTVLNNLIRSRVLNAEGTPVAGAYVQLLRQKSHAVTAADGSFQLQASLPDTLLVEHVGYRPLKLIVSNSGGIIILEAISNTLTDVVVQTGYQALARSRANGSFVQVDKALLDRRVSTNILDRLDGVTSGLVFNKTNISDEAISIRGRSTLVSESASPLIVVDNFPYEGNISNINPNDVESITVLKDAAAAAIWGARSGNGVIVITTTRGRLNQSPRWTFQSSLTMAERSNLYYSRNWLDAANYIGIEQFLFGKGYYDANLNNTSTRPALSPVVELLAMKRSGALSAAEVDSRLSALQQQDVRRDFSAYVYQPELRQQYSLGVTGGGSQFSYNGSVGVDQNRENLVGNGNQRLTLRLNNSYTPVKGLELTAGIAYTQASQDAGNSFSYQSSETMYNGTSLLYPYAQLRDGNGVNLAIAKSIRDSYKDSLAKLGFPDWQYRPLDEIAFGDNRSRTGDLVLQAGVSYSLRDGLRLQLLYQHEGQSITTRNYRSEQTYYARNLIDKFAQRNTSTGVITYVFPRGGILDLSSSELNSEQLRTQLSFNRTLRKHSVSALAGVEARELMSRFFSRSSYGYDDQFGTAVGNLNYATAFPTNPFGTAALPAPPSNFSETTRRFLSAYLNAVYNYDGRYTASFSARQDGANLFGVQTNQRFIPLMSAGLGWTLSKERWYHTDWLPMLRLRSTYGYNGNAYNGSAYLIAKYSSSSLTGLQNAAPVTAPNPALRWERVRNLNWGIDFESRNQRLSGSIEYYVKQGMDLVEDAPLAPSTGFSSFTGNAAETRTRGIDLTLHARLISRPSFLLQSTLLLSTVNDRVLRYDPQYTAVGLARSTGGLIAVTGKPLFGMYSYRFGGLDPINGDPIGYLQGQSSKNYTTILNSTPIDSLVFHGSARPTVFGSWRTTLEWRNWSVSVNIVYKLGYYFRRAALALNYQDIIATGMNTDYAARWQQPGDEARTNVPSVAYPYDLNRSDFYRYSSALVEKGDHVRLQDLRMGYRYNRRLELFYYINTMALLWRANHAGLDPDANDNAGGRIYPPARSISLGLSLHF